MKIKLKECVQLVKDRTSIENVDLASYISTDNMLPNRKGVDFNKSSKPKAKTVLMYQKGDVLISNIRPYFKKIWMADRNGTRSGDILAFRVNKSGILQKYLYCILQSDIFFDYVMASAKGTKMPRGDKNAILDFEFEVPSIEKQKKVYKPILTIEKKINLNNKINTNLLAIAKEKYQKMLASSLLTKTKLKDFATITMGQSPSSKTYNKEKQGVALLNGATDFRNGIHPSKWTTDPKKVVNKGAYIFGVRATIGLTTKVFNKYAIGRGTGSAVSKDTTNDEFLYFVLNDIFKDFKNTGSGSVYINISKKDLNEYTFYKPKINELISFHQTIAPIMNKIYTNNQENIVLTEIKENLLKQFF